MADYFERCDFAESYAGRQLPANKSSSFAAFAQAQIRTPPWGAAGFVQRLWRRELFGYVFRTRRMKPARLSRPVPIRASVPGSGVTSMVPLATAPPLSPMLTSISNDWKLP